MEIRIIGRGALAGLLAGIVAFVFSLIFVEPLVDRAIDYEEERSGLLDSIAAVVGLPVGGEGPDIVSRAVQSTAGLATGIIAVATAMGALVAVGYLVMHGRLGLRPAALAAGVAAFGFLGVYLLPFVKYPANPPAIGHEFTIGTRSLLYVTMVACSLVLLGLAVMVARGLAPRIGRSRGMIVAAAGFLLLFGILIGVLPSLGNLAANVNVASEFGFAQAATETPQPIVNVLSKPLLLNGATYAPGQVILPGFDADLLWKFRWYSIINQLIIWTGIALIFGALADRLLAPRSGGVRPGQPADDTAADREAV